MAQIKLKLPVVRVRLTLEPVVIRFPSRIRVPRSFGLSVAFHGLMLLMLVLAGGATQKRAAVSQEVWVSFVAPSSGTAAPVTGRSGSDGISMGGPKSGGFASLLGQVVRGVGKPGAGARLRQEAGQADVSGIAGELKKEWMRSALAQANITTQDGDAVSAKDKELIRKAIAARETVMRRCHEKALLIESSLSGQADLLLSTDLQGRVSRVGLAFSGQGGGPAQADLKQCLADSLKGLMLPKGAVGHEVKFSLLLR